MAKHPTLVQIVKQALERLELTQKDAAARIGVSHTTFAKFLAGQEVGQASMEKIRAFSENPGSSTPAKPAKGKKKGKGSEITLEDLDFLQSIGLDDFRFVLRVMKATGKTSLTREQMLEVVALRK